MTPQTEPPRDEFVAHCSCGRRHTRGAWQQLARAGYLRPPGAPVQEFRLCPCGKTPFVTVTTEPMLVGEFHLLKGGIRRWERSVKDPRWGGRICAESCFHAWHVTVVFSDKRHKRLLEVNAAAEHGDPDLALASLLEEPLNLPTEFLAAFALPL